MAARRGIVEAEGSRTRHRGYHHLHRPGASKAGWAGYYSLIDVLAYPRQMMRITDLVTPLKPLEAMAQKRLFVASDVGGQGTGGRWRDRGAAAAPGTRGAGGKLGGLLDDPQRARRTPKEAGRRHVENDQSGTFQWRPPLGLRPSHAGSLEPPRSAGFC